MILALMIGNSRLHWGLFIDDGLVYNWNSSYLPIDTIKQISQSQFTIPHFPLPTPHSPLRILLASVVPTQTALWQNYPDVRILTLENVPLQGLYPTLGIDRALALYGAASVWGFPMLVIDAGTALTFTGADENQNLVGGAILPGLGLQFSTLSQKTGQLPYVETQSLPKRYVLNTAEAIQSGVVYTLLAGIKGFVEAWWQDFPQGKVALTGGDRILLSSYLQGIYPEIGIRLMVEENLILWGMGEIIKTP
ncbi:MAG: pantothenate kinase [Scytonematopsis contorta HA4267-MV1]|nr:pantothenate kinase [Scytonematopsis contorta HA4267-MV1]